MRTPLPAAIVLILAAAACVAISDPAYAQRRRVRVRPSRPVVVAGAFDPFWFDPWFAGPYGYGVYPPYGISPRSARAAARCENSSSP